MLNRSFFWIIYAYVLVRFIPLRWFNSLLGEYRKEEEMKLNEEQVQQIEIITKNIRRLKRRVPWKVKCFEEAIVAKKVLEKYKIRTTLYLGVKKESKQNLKAHAWLKSGNNFITGEKGHTQYSVVAFYS